MQTFENSFQDEYIEDVLLPCLCLRRKQSRFFSFYHLEPLIDYSFCVCGFILHGRTHPHSEHAAKYQI